MFHFFSISFAGFANKHSTLENSGSITVNNFTKDIPSEILLFLTKTFSVVLVDFSDILSLFDIVSNFLSFESKSSF